MQLTDLTALGLDEERARQVLALCLRELDGARRDPAPTLDSGLPHGGAPAANPATLRAALEAHYHNEN